jgi:DNA-binding NarL/FixJ family response regulator
MCPARVLVVDDEDAVRRAFLRSLSGAGYETQGAESCATARKLFAGWKAASYDVVILDLCLKDGQAYDLLPIIKKLDPPPAVAVVSGFLDNDALLKLFGSCALALPKPVAATTLQDLIEKLAGGRLPQQLAEEYGQAKELSERQIELLVCAVDGSSYKEAAAKLGLEKSTVACYWSRVFKKTGCTSQVEVLASMFRFAARW